MSPSLDQTAHADLLRNLASCRKAAANLGYKFLQELLTTAMVETAINWEGGPASRDKGFDSLIRIKLRMLMAERSSNIVALYPEIDDTKG